MPLIAEQRRQPRPTERRADLETQVSLGNGDVSEESRLAKTLRYMGLMAWQNGQLEEAVQHFSNAVSVAPDDPALLSELGSVLSATGRKPEARAAIKRSLEIDSRQAQAWLTLAGICIELGDKEDAEQAYLSALLTAPESPQALTGLGLLYLEQRRYHEATRSLSAAVARGVDAFGVHACLGQAWFLIGDVDSSHHCFQRAVRLQPQDERLLKKLGLVRLIRALRERAAPEAMRDYQSLVSCDGEAALAACREAFHYLAGYGYDEAAIKTGDYLLGRAPQDSIIGYQLAALRGLPRARAPDDYLKAYFDRFAETFDRQLVENLKYRVPELCCGHLARLGTRFGKMLDLGCGTGLAAPYLSKLGGALTGVDISTGMLEKARARGLYSELIGAEAVEFLKNSTEIYGLIVALDVLVYFGDLRPLFDGAANRLAPGGVFAMSYEANAERDITALTSGRFGHSPGYIRQISAEKFETLFEATTMLRLEANRPVDGRIALLRRR